MLKGFNFVEIFDSMLVNASHLRAVKISQFMGFDARYWTFSYNFGKKVVLLPKLYLSLRAETFKLKR